MQRPLRNRDQALLTVAVGPLEMQTMEILWTSGECKVKDVMKALHRHLAYTTVMTTLDRLYRKKLASRRKCARAYLYSPNISWQEWKDAAARALLNKLAAGPNSSRELLIECLIKSAGQQPSTVTYGSAKTTARRSGVLNSRKQR